MLRLDPWEVRRQVARRRRAAGPDRETAAGTGPDRQAGARADRRRPPQPEADRHAPEGRAAQRTRRARGAADGRIAGETLPPPARLWGVRGGLSSPDYRSEEPTAELQSLMRRSYAVLGLKK